MARSCTVCALPPDRRREVDQRLAAGTGLRALSAEFRVSEDALGRHAKAHLPVRLLQRQAVAEAREAVDVAAILGRCAGAAVAVLEEAQRAGRLDVVLRAVDRLLGCAALQARVADAAATATRWARRSISSTLRLTSA